MITRRLFYGVFLFISVVMPGVVTGSVLAQPQPSATQTSGCSGQVGIIDEWQDGEIFDDSAFALGLTPLTRVEVRYGNIVDTIEAFYGSESAGLHGVTNPDSKPSVVKIAPDDALVEVSGYYGTWFGQDYILQLTFRTREGKTFGPYDNIGYAATLVPFTFRAPENMHIAGFCGGNLPGNDGTALLLGALGVILVRDQILACSGWVGDYESDQFGIPFDDTAFAQGSTPLTQLKLHYGNIIDTIRRFMGRKVPDSTV